MKFLEFYSDMRVGVFGGLGYSQVIFLEDVKILKLSRGFLRGMFFGIWDYIRFFFGGGNQ